MIDALPDPDIPDSYYAEYDPEAGWQGQGEAGSEFGGSEAYADPGSVAPSNMEDWGEEGTDLGDGEGEGEEGDVFGDEEEEDGEGEGYDECVYILRKTWLTACPGSWQRRFKNKWTQ